MKWKRGRNHVLVLGLLGVPAVTVGSDATAQTRKPLLRVHPQEMATATQTVRAGEQTLDGQPLTDTMQYHWMNQKLHCKYSLPCATYPRTVYVPQSCVGSRRCPLVVYENVSTLGAYHMADKYGMIVAHLQISDMDTSVIVRVDRDLQQVLRTFAIDPDKIAILGRCGSGQQTLDYAAANPTVFSRVVVGTHHNSDPQPKSPQQTTEYLLATGILDQGADFAANFPAVQRLRDRGYAVTNSLQFRAHVHTYEEYDFMGHWLQQSWAIPNPAARPVPYTFSDPPLLTIPAITQLAAFWTRFMKEPDTIRITGRQAFVREMVIPVGKERVSTLMIDMPALAARYPSVAAAFRAAKLTPRQHEIYQAALGSAYIYGTQLDRFSSVDSLRSFLRIQSTSAVVKNYEFMVAHRDELVALEETDLWRPELAEDQRP